MKASKKKKPVPSKLQPYVPIVHFLGKALGSNYEVFLYDLTDQEHRIVAIENGYISGRTEGSLMRDVIIKMLKEDETKADSLIQKNAVSRDGRRFKSSTMLIKDEDGVSIGALCINFNIEGFFKVNEILKSFQVDIASFEKINLSKVIFTGEVFEDSDRKMDNLDLAYKRALIHNPMIDLTSVTGRQAAMDMLYNEGIFEIRGSVSYVADKMGISEPSVYRYLNNSKGKDV